MREVMRCYAETKEHSPDVPLPRILGLTASVISKKVKPAEKDSMQKILQMLKNLECCLDSQIVTAADYNQVLKFTTNPFEYLVQYGESSNTSSSAEDAVSQDDSIGPFFSDSEELEDTTKIIEPSVANVGGLLNSDKFKKLLTLLLQAIKDFENNLCGIIFVQKRCMARLVFHGS